MLGDYLDIPNLQAAIGAAGTVSTTNRICGVLWNVIAAATTQATVCSFTTPFRVGVHFDSDDHINADADWNHVENTPTAYAAAPQANAMGTPGIGTTGFYLAYWQNTC